MWIKIAYGVEIFIALFGLVFVGVLAQDWISEVMARKRMRRENEKQRRGLSVMRKW